MVVGRRERRTKEQHTLRLWTIRTLHCLCRVRTFKEFCLGLENGPIPVILYETVLFD